MKLSIIPSDELERLRSLEQWCREAHGPDVSFIEATTARLRIKRALGLISKDEEIKLNQYMRGKP